MQVSLDFMAGRQETRMVKRQGWWVAAAQHACEPLSSSRPQSVQCKLKSTVWPHVQAFKTSSLVPTGQLHLNFIFLGLRVEGLRFISCPSDNVLEERGKFLAEQNELDQKFCSSSWLIPKRGSYKIPQLYVSPITNSKTTTYKEPGLYVSHVTNGKASWVLALWKACICPISTSSTLLQQAVSQFPCRQWGTAVQASLTTVQWPVTLRQS